MVAPGSAANAPRQAAKHLKQDIFRVLDAAAVAAAAAGGHKGGDSGAGGPVQRVMYVDADVDVNAPLGPFFAAVGEWDPGCSAYMFRERWYAKSAFNGGAMLVDRHHSAAWLAAWKAALQDHPEVSPTLISFMFCCCPSPSFGAVQGMLVCAGAASLQYYNVRYIYPVPARPAGALARHGRRVRGGRRSGVRRRAASELGRLL